MVVIGGGHNGLVAATILARAGKSVLVLERRDHVGGAAVSERPWPGVDARLSRYSYLVSLMPRRAARAARPERADAAALGLVLLAAPGRHRAAACAPASAPSPNWAAFYEMCGRVARAVFPTLTEPLLSRAQMRARIGDLAAWEALIERPARRGPVEVLRG